MNVNVSNVVSTAELSSSVDLEEIDKYLGDTSRNPDNYAGLIIENSDGPTIALFKNKLIAYVNDPQDMHSSFDWLEGVLPEGIECENYKIKNVVANTDIGRELNLNSLVIGLGLEQSEYEPEQFPAVIFKPPMDDGRGDYCALIFSTGKIVIVGGNNLEHVEESAEDVKNRIEELFDSITI